LSTQASDITQLSAVAGQPAETRLGQLVIYPTREGYVEAVKSIYNSGYELCSDLCAVDYLQHMDRPLPDGVKPERFEIVVNLTSVTRHERVRLRVQVPESDPHIATLFEVYPGSENMEREAFDMFGIVFDDHPDMSRILMPEDWEGHPLRKDYSVGRVPVQFKQAPGPR
jgi:NADH-quinone oxidoreductase subunit C